MTDKTFQGRRVSGKEPHQLELGEYGHWASVWYARCPDGSCANLRSHTVIIHEDGTITVSPSILTSTAEKQLWHGFLERGVWMEC